jgi:tRNA(adenine34) deaminase
MKKIALLVCLILLAYTSLAQQGSTPATKTDLSYFITHTREELIDKLVDMPFGINHNDPVDVMLDKIKTYLVAFTPDPEYSDDIYAMETNMQALKSVMQGGYGIGAVLIDQEGKIIASAHNSQIQKRRSDLHAEMTLLTNFEKSCKSKKYMRSHYVYKPGMIVFSSTEPCPMCFIRIITTGCNIKYCTPGPEDGMVSRVDYLPAYWRDLAKGRTVDLGDCSPEMQKLGHLLFYSYLLDNRGPQY